MEFLHEAWFWILVTTASELIGVPKLKDNSIIELIIHTVMKLKPSSLK